MTIKGTIVLNGVLMDYVPLWGCHSINAPDRLKLELVAHSQNARVSWPQRMSKERVHAYYHPEDPRCEGCQHVKRTKG